MKLSAGDQIGAYKIVAPIGKGGMATVYKAYHERLDRYVAIKFMHDTFVTDDEFQARFQREARIVAKLEHPNIVPIYDYNEHEHTPYLVMRFIDGMTLKKRAIKTGITLEETRQLLTDVATGVDYAHGRGILHRDLKPSNILLDEDHTPYITDFGLARIAEVGASTISHDMMLGTPYYISPEQAQGSKDLDARTDLYSLGVILYEMITGRVPFEADTPYGIVHGHLYRPIEPPSDLNPELNTEIDAVLEKALAKSPLDRYNSAGEMMAAFTAALETLNDYPSVLVDITAFDPPIEQRDQEAKQPSTAIVDPPTPQERRNTDDYLSAIDATLNATDDQLSELFTEDPQRAEARKRKAPAETNLSIDLGTVEWSNLGRNIQAGFSNFAEQIEDRIDTELRQRHGVELTEEELIRRQVRKKVKARREFVQQLGSYLMVNSGLVVLWLFTGAGFFWPIFPIFFWGLGVVTQGFEYYSKHGPGAEKTASQIEQEVQRELQRRINDTASGRKNKQKNVDPQKAPDRLSLDDLASGGGSARVDADGELTDSFIREQGRRS